MVKRGFKLDSLQAALDELLSSGKMPEKYRPHILSGKWEGVWECHISSDWLLLYDVSDTIKLIRLVRTGTHSDIFKK